MCCETAALRYAGLSNIAAKSRLTSSFLMFYTRVPDGFQKVDDVRLEDGKLMMKTARHANDRSCSLAKTVAASTHSRLVRPCFTPPNERSFQAMADLERHYSVATRTLSLAAGRGWEEVVCAICRAFVVAALAVPAVGEGITKRSTSADVPDH